MKDIFIIFALGFMGFHSKAIGYSAFQKVNVDPSYKEKVLDYEVKNMPRVTSQDGLGICYAHVAATLMQAENCRYMKVQDCASLPEDKLFSPLDLTRFRDANEKGEMAELRSFYEGLNVDGGSAHNVAIIGALIVKQTGNESCISLDRILSKMNSRNETEQAQVAMWASLQKRFEAVKKRAKGKEGCEQCLSDIYTTAADEASTEITNNLNLKADNVKIAKAFAEDTYFKFLDVLLGGTNCRRSGDFAYFENADRVEYKSFPESSSVSDAEMKSQIQKVLQNGRPVALGAICMGNEPPSNCNPNNLHGVVVSGYRVICKDKSKQNCRYAFKVVNSWGKSWQDRFDGGWVDADALLGRVMKSPNILGWFADKK